MKLLPATIFVGILLTSFYVRADGLVASAPSDPAARVDHMADNLSEADKKLLPNLCERPEAALVRSTKITDSPEFYFRPLPKSDKLIYSASGDPAHHKDYHNYLLYLASGKKTILPGMLDAFPSPDENLLILSQGESGLAIYDMASPDHKILDDPDMKGYYQSCGILPANGGPTTYRIMIDNSGKGFKFSDYKFNPSTKSLQKINSASLCASQPGQLSTPMMSKDGRFLAAYNLTTQTTKVYSIDSKTGACGEVNDLGVTTGKVDFSYDGNSVAFSQIAVRSVQNRPGEPDFWLRTPNDDMVANVYTKDLKTGETRALTHYHNTSVLYPAYTMKNQIISRKFDPEGAEFITLNPAAPEKKVDVSLTAQLSKCCGTLPRNVLQILGLGTLFLDYCAKELRQWNAESVALLGQDLSKAQCQTLAQFWAKPKAFSDLSFLKVSPDASRRIGDGLKEISANDIRAACDLH